MDQTRTLKHEREQHYHTPSTTPPPHHMTRMKLKNSKAENIGLTDQMEIKNNSKVMI